MLIDGLQCGSFTRETFVRLRKAGMTCVTVTCGYWEGTMESLDTLATWRQLIRDNADVAMIATSVADIHLAEKTNKLAVLLGFQNAACLEGRISYVEFFADLGVRNMQLTYNNQNELGGSCYEVHDSGLARFGREVVREMNRCGILVDLSHVGNVTTLDAIRHSEKPVVISHANADSLHSHRRNKTDEVLKALSDNGGVIGCSAYNLIAGDQYMGSVEAWGEMIAKTVEIAGIDHVGVGSDHGEGVGQPELNWMRMGRWTRGIDYGAAKPGTPAGTPAPIWLAEAKDFARIPQGLKHAGFNEAEIQKIVAGNWLRVYEAAFG